MRILSVDDKSQNRALLERALRSKFDIASSDGSEPILPLLEQHKPDVILMDIMLGQSYTGYDLVKELRSCATYAECEVIFISALDSSEDKLLAYGCGGDDYISKPVDVNELLEKLKRVEVRISERALLKEQFEMASDTAFCSMQQANELGTLISFFTDSLDVTEIEELFENIRRYYGNAGVRCSCEFRVANTYHQFPKQSTTDLEREILELGRVAKRIVPFGSNMLFNSRFCSMLVKGMPVHDELLMGRARDNFAILLTIVDSRIEFIEEQLEKEHIRKKAIEELKSQLEGDFSTIKALCEEQDNQIAKFISKLSQDIQLKVITLGLDEEQEAALMSLIDEAQEVVEEAQGISFVIEDKLFRITQQLRIIEQPK